MAQMQDKIDRRLRKSLAEGIAVRIVRKNLEDAEHIDGVVQQFTPEWVVIAILDGVYPDGFDIVRRKDITKVRHHTKAHQEFTRRALSAIGTDQLSCPATLTPGMSVPDVLHTVAAISDVLGFYIEKETADATFIGRIVEFRKKKFNLHFIKPNGRWEEGLREYTYKEVTRVFFAGRYERALADFGDPYPEQN